MVAQPSLPCPPHEQRIARRADFFCHCGCSPSQTGPGVLSLTGTIFCGGDRHGRPICSESTLRTQRRSAGGHRRPGRRRTARTAEAGAAGRHRLRQDLHHGLGDREGAEAHPGHCPQQDPGRPALLGAEGLLPGQPGGVLRLLLRLLSAGGLHRLLGYLHREGRLHQRGNRPHAPLRHRGPAGAQGRDHRRVGELHLLHGRPQRVRGADDLPAPGHAHRPGQAASHAHRHPVRAQRHRVRQGHLPRAGGRGGDHPRRGARACPAH